MKPTPEKGSRGLGSRATAAYLASQVRREHLAAIATRRRQEATSTAVRQVAVKPIDA